MQNSTLVVLVLLTFGQILMMTFGALILWLMGEFGDRPARASPGADRKRESLLAVGEDEVRLAHAEGDGLLRLAQELSIQPGDERTQRLPQETERAGVDHSPLHALKRYLKLPKL